MQEQGELANSGQVVSCLGLELKVLVLLGGSANRSTTVLPPVMRISTPRENEEDKMRIINLSSVILSNSNHYIKIV